MGHLAIKTINLSAGLLYPRKKLVSTLLSVAFRIVNFDKKNQLEWFYDYGLNFKHTGAYTVPHSFVYMGHLAIKTIYLSAGLLYLRKKLVFTLLSVAFRIVNFDKPSSNGSTNMG